MCAHAFEGLVDHRQPAMSRWVILAITSVLSEMAQRSAIDGSAA